MKTLLFLLCASLAFAAPPEAFRDVKLPPDLSIPTKYVYKAKVLKVVDGDTVDLEIQQTVQVKQDAGFHIKIGSVAVTMEDRFRLYGINAWGSTAPEAKTPEEKKKGIAAKAYLTDLLTGKDVYVVSKKDGREKYGRWLAIILISDDRGSYSVVNQLLVDLGHAVYADY